MAIDNYSLLKYLQANGITSGELLGEVFGVSRAAISKRLKSLDSVVESIPAKGYQLKSGCHFVTDEALVALSQRYPNVKFDTQLQLPSTNTELIAQARAGDTSPAVLVAELQTSGRGRRGRVWQQPLGTGLSFSLRWSFDGGFNILAGLSLSVGLWIAEALSELNYEIELKWPNDLYLNGAKLGGILVEVEGDANGPVTVVVGVGINLTSVPDVGQKVSCLGDVDKDEVLLRIVRHCFDGLSTFDHSGFAPLRTLWMERALWMDRPVSVISGENVRTGVYRGVTDRGELLFDEAGVIKELSGGEISLRSAE